MRSVVHLRNAGGVWWTAGSVLIADADRAIAERTNAGQPKKAK